MVNAQTRAERSALRRADIIAAAARLFRQNGFVAVGVDDIGAAVGVSGPATYRHFAGKDAVLAEVVAGYLERIREKAATAADPGRRADLATVIEVSLQNPDALAVMLRHIRYLDDASLRRVRSLYAEAAPSTCSGSLIDGGTEESHLRTRAAAGVLVSAALAHEPAQVLRRRVVDDMVAAVLARPLPETPAGAPVGQVAGGPVAAPLIPASRREAILASATRLFRQNSFHGVSLRDIGDDVGVTPSAIRKHFGNKEDLLAALFNRGGEQVAAAIASVLQESTTAAEAVEGMIVKYAELALQSRDRIFVYVTETHALPVSQQDERRSRQRGHVNELAYLQSQIEPGLSRGECRLRAVAAFSLINEVVMNDRLIERHGLAAELSALALSVMRLPSAAGAA